MSLEERARRAARSAHAAVGDLPSLEVLDRRRVRRERRRRAATVLVAVALASVSTWAVTRAFKSDEHVAATPPRGRILYGDWNASTQRAHWFTANADGTDVRDLGVVATCAAWWPDGSKILITDDAAVGPGRPLRPAIVDPDGSDVRPLDATRKRDLNLGCGGVSPDGSTLVVEGFGTKGTSVNGIYTIRSSDGGGLVRLTHGEDGSPRFSPDGAQIAFFRARAGVSPPGSGALFVMNADGSDRRRITPWGGAFLGQSWSPDGRWIAFEHPYGELYLVHPDGSGLHRVPLQLPEGAGASNPAWSPDGARIAISVTSGGSQSIQTVRPDGTGLTRVVAVRGADLQSPDWDVTAS